MQKLAVEHETSLAPPPFAMNEGSAPGVQDVPPSFVISTGSGRLEFWPTAMQLAVDPHATATSFCVPIGMTS
jgi:hypothetical protein